MNDVLSIKVKASTPVGEPEYKARSFDNHGRRLSIKLEALASKCHTEYKTENYDAHEQS